MHELIFREFPGLTDKQQNQVKQMFDLYLHWNQQINVISRKDMDNFYERHVLHSLGIAKAIMFEAGTEVLDVGTGGGFPGIPLAILFPDVQFTLADSIGKKIKVVQAVSEALELKNVETFYGRAESVPSSFHFIVSRAVTTLPEFMSWTRNKIKKESFNKLPNGILYLKGGDLSQEIGEVSNPIRIFNLSDYFNEEFFLTKKVVYVNCASKTQKKP